MHRRIPLSSISGTRLSLEDLGRTLSRRPRASGKDPESYERFAVEEEVKDIVDLGT